MVDGCRLRSAAAARLGRGTPDVSFKFKGWVAGGGKKLIAQRGSALPAKPRNKDTSLRGHGTRQIRDLPALQCKRVHWR